MLTLGGGGGGGEKGVDEAPGAKAVGVGRILEPIGPSAALSLQRQV